MAFATFPVSQAVEVGPNARSCQYVIQIPAGTGMSDGAYLGPVDNIPGSSFGIHVSAAAASSASAGACLTVYGTFDGPSIAPSGRNWWVARGDTPPSTPSGTGADLGLNKYLLAVTVGGMIEVRGPARAYRFRVSCGPSNISAAITLTVLAVKPIR